MLLLKLNIVLLKKELSTSWSLLLHPCYLEVWTLGHQDSQFFRKETQSASNFDISQEQKKTVQCVGQIWSFIKCSIPIQPWLSTKTYISGTQRGINTLSYSSILCLFECATNIILPILDIRISVLRPSVTLMVPPTPPPWILKRGGLQSSGQKIISSIGKAKRIQKKISAKKERIKKGKNDFWIF